MRLLNSEHASSSFFTLTNEFQKAHRSRIIFQKKISKMVWPRDFGTILRILLTFFTTNIANS